MQKKKNKEEGILNRLLSLVPIASAAGITDAARKVDGVAKKADINEMLLTIINYALIVLGVLAVAVFIYAGFLYLTAAGVQERIDKAKNTLLYAVIGIVVAVLGYVAVATVEKFIVRG
jgi:GTP cyclohydrolase I